MLSIFKKKQLKGNQSIFKIEGMHCTSCVMNIDGILEDLDGVIDSSTSYRKGETRVQYDPKLIDEKQIVLTINEAGYTASNAEA